MLRRSHLRKTIWQCLTAFLLASGLSLTAAGALIGGGLERVCLITAAAVSVGMTLAGSLLKGKWKLLLLLIPAVEAALYLNNMGLTREWVQAVLSRVLEHRGVYGASMPYRGDLAVMAAALISLCCAALALEENLPLTAAAVTLSLAALMLVSPDKALLPCALPALAGLIMIFAAGHGRPWHALPLALAVPLIAYLIIPPQGTVQEDMSRFARDVRDHTADYLFFNEERDAFSMAGEGWQPLGTRLGGKARPDGGKVMTVTGEPGEDVYLRARAYDFYDGLNWSDSLSGARHLYDGPGLFGGGTTLRDTLFQADYPLAGRANAARKLTVHMLADDTTTVYAPWHTVSFTGGGDRMVLYFNDGSELFITRNFAPGDEYTLEYIPYAAGETATEELIRLNADAGDPNYDKALVTYAVRPDHIQADVFDLAEEITGVLTDPYEKALAIRDWLKTHYAYSLDVEEPPDSVDFAAWFLLKEEKGYCAYFATAMTVLCRMAGIPARYVVGYHAVLDDGGRADITGAQAHAWTEIYLNGFGWLTLDATPGDGRSGTGDGQKEEPPKTTPTPPPPENGDEPDNGDGPDSGDGQPDETPSPEPEGGAETPTPPPEEDALPPGGGTPPDPAAKEEKDRLPWLLLILLILLAALVIWRLRATEPVRRAAKAPDEGALILYTAALRLLRAGGYRKQDGETLLEYGERLDSVMPEASLGEAMADLSAFRYGTKRGGDTALAEKCYRAVKEKAGLWAAFRAAAARLVKEPKLY